MAVLLADLPHEQDFFCCVCAARPIVGHDRSAVAAEASGQEVQAPNSADAHHHLQVVVVFSLLLASLTGQQFCARGAQRRRTARRQEPRRPSARPSTFAGRAGRDRSNVGGKPHGTGSSKAACPNLVTFSVSSKLTRDEESDEDNSYDVEAIHGTKGKGKTLMYLVEWEGYPEEKDRTWEPVANLAQNHVLAEWLERSKV